MYWLLKHVLLGPWLRWIFKPEVEGVEHVPDRGPAILASNHLSYTDWLFMPLVISRRVTFVAKADYFVGEGVKGKFQKWFFSNTGQVPIDRSSGDAAAGALNTGLQILAGGELFGIFPEGTRSHDGRLYKGKTGVARMALAAQVPVIPVAVIGTDEIAPPGKVFGRLVRPQVRFGKPMDFSRYYGMEDDRFVLRSITDEIMYQLMLLSGQEYVDIYAAKAKSKLAQVARNIGEGAATVATNIGEGAAAVATNLNEKIHAARTGDESTGEADGEPLPVSVEAVREG
ncbi:lysophospholipid acyltransferase family protein [Branchiibius cervicis]|uniref:Lysophospholipid acyltransferase family protein n=1 Tax=Branchiibius cervicis TaxID=908252 RepID=A0ABW2ARQ9_9MICO